MKPTKIPIKFGSMISTSGDRCAYFEGAAYLLPLSFFCGGETADLVSVVIVTVVRARFADDLTDAEGVVLFGRVLDAVN